MNKTSLLVAVALTATALTAAPLTAPASAQDYGTDSYGYDSIGTNVLMNSMMDKHLMDKVIARQPQSGMGNKSSVSKTKVPPPKATAVRGSTRFRTDSAARKTMLAGLVAKARKTNPKAADALQRDLAKGDPIVAIAPALRRYGLRTDDVADSMAAYLVSSWYGVRGSNQDPARAYIQSTRAQMSRALLSAPGFAKSSNAAKQQLSDALLLQIMVNDRQLASAKGDAAKMAKVKSNIRQNVLQTLQLDLSKIKLTNKGLSA